MTKKMVIIIFMAIFLFQGFMLTATDEVKKEVPKKIKKLMKKGAKYIAKGNKAEKPEKKDGYYKDALAKYNEALKIDEKFAPAYFQKAMLSYIIKDFENTVKLLQKTIALDPTHDKAQSTLAQLYLKNATEHQNKKEFAKMLVCQEKFIAMPYAKEKMAPAYSRTIYKMGVFNSMLKNLEKGNEYLGKYIASFKDKEKNQMYYFSIYTAGINNVMLMEKEMGKDNPKKEIEIAKKIANKYSEIETYLSESFNAPQATWTEDAGLRLGTYYIYKGDYENAKSTFESLIKKYPTSKDIQVYENLLKRVNIKK